jgi:hypothetical protein
MNASNITAFRSIAITLPITASVMLRVQSSILDWAMSSKSSKTLPLIANDATEQIVGRERRERVS